MTLLNAANLSLYDIAQRTDSSGKALAIAELLQQKNEVLDDVIWIPSNEGTGYKYAQRTAHPTVANAKISGSYPVGKSAVENKLEACGLYKHAIEIPEDIYDLAKDKNALKLSESTPAIEALNQDFSTAIFYDTVTANPDSLNGLSMRVNTAANSQFIDAGGASSDNASIWLVCWAPHLTACFYPDGTKAGLDMVDEGMVSTKNSDGSYSKNYVVTFKQWGGLKVQDHRYIIRIGNVDISSLLTVNDTSDISANIIKFMDFSIDQLQDLTSGRCAFYMNRTVKKCLRQMMKTHPRVNLTLGDLYNRQNVMTYDGIPIRTVDSLLSTEARIV